MHTRFKNDGVTRYLHSQSDYRSLDFTRVFAGGDSAGGYLAIQSGLTQPAGTIKVVLGCYPMTNYLRRNRQPIFMDEPEPPESIINEHVAQIEPGTIISDAPPRPRNRISYALSAYGRYNEFFGTGERLWPISIMGSSNPPSHMPPTLILHGDKDTAVSIDDSRAFVKKVVEVFGEEVDIQLIEREGQDHGFDGNLSEREGWVKDMVTWIEERWIR